MGLKLRQCYRLVQTRAKLAARLLRVTRVSRHLAPRTAQQLVPHRAFFGMGNVASAGNPIGARAQAIFKKEHADSGARERATVAGGCFWGLELTFQRVPGVIRTSVGYTAGHMIDPTYEDVCTGMSGHTEAVDMEFDPATVSYSEILDVFWDQHDPTTLNRQGNDCGTQYRSGIYCHTEEQQKIAESSKAAEAERLGRPVVTEIAQAGKYYMAEAYHQQYLAKGGQCAAKGDLTGIRCYG